MGEGAADFVPESVPVVGLLGRGGGAFGRGGFEDVRDLGVVFELGFGDVGEEVFGTDSDFQVVLVELVVDATLAVELAGDGLGQLKVVEFVEFVQAMVVVG